MRSRPRLEVSLVGPRHGGSELEAVIDMVARSETPIDWVKVTLLGKMSRYVSTSIVNDVSSDHWESYVLVALEANLSGGTLTGKRTERVSFKLPAGLPPTFRSATTKIEYTLDVHISIPWWPDRRRIYEVPIELAPMTLPDPQPLLMTTSSREMPLLLELSLADRLIVPAQPIDGAVSLQDKRGRSIRRVELSLIAIDEALVKSQKREVEVLRSTAIIVDGDVAEGQSVPFRLMFPRDFPPTFFSPLMKLEHRLEIRVVVAWDADLVVFVPIQVVPATSTARGGMRPMRGRHVPPVGAERRAKVWAEIAQGGRFELDAEAERLHWSSGAVRGAITVESRGEVGLWTVAKLRWPALGIDLRASGRSWTDALRRAVPIADPLVKERFTVRGRSVAQTAAFFDALATLPATVEQASFDDDGCVLSSPGGGFSRDELEHFVKCAESLAQAIEAARVALPPPAEMAGHVAAWRAFAARTGGTVHMGEPRIEGSSIRGEPIELATEWDREAIVRTELTVLRRARTDDDAGAPEDETPDADAAARLPAAAAAVLDRAKERGGELRATAARLTLALPGPLADPSTIEPQLEALAAWAKALRQETEQGPYR